VKIRKDGQPWPYSINEESPLVKRRDAFDNSLIESMVGEEEFKKRSGRTKGNLSGRSRKIIRTRIRKGSVLS
jgi:hypothetical protein